MSAARPNQRRQRVSIDLDEYAAGPARQLRDAEFHLRAATGRSSLDVAQELINLVSSKSTRRRTYKSSIGRGTAQESIFMPLDSQYFQLDEFLFGVLNPTQSGGSCVCDSPHAPSAPGASASGAGEDEGK
jgi:hypothetical protein